MRVVTTAGFERDLRRLAPDMVTRVLAAMSPLALDPRPAGCRLLRDWHPPTWRVRVGDYRVLYEINESVGTVTVTAVRHRSSVY